MNAITGCPHPIACSMRRCGPAIRPQDRCKMQPDGRDVPSRNSEIRLMSAALAQAAKRSGIDTGILLEAGTNEAEVLVFRVSDRRFGVNVAKVREVLPIESVTEIPKSHPAVDGLVRIRDAVVPLVSLERFLYGTGPEHGDQRSDSLVLLEFNNHQIAFRVDRVERIFRVSWKDTLPAPQLGEDPSPVTSILRQKDGLVPLLDFESISATIGIGGRAASVAAATTQQAADRSQLPIVYAEDSQMIGEMVKDALIEAGYSNVKGFADGQFAWEYLSSLGEQSGPDAIGHKVACVVTDIEMPRLDGLSLTRKLREHAVLGKVPVVVFSSIATKDNEKKSRQVGASAQVSKPRYDDLVSTVNALLSPAAAN